MNYIDLFRATLPETALEIAALLVLVVDLGFLRKAALKTRMAAAALLGVAGCAAAFGRFPSRGHSALAVICSWPRVVRRASRKLPFSFLPR